MSNERQQARRRKLESHDAAETEPAQVPFKAASARLTPMDMPGRPRIWVLPTAHGLDPLPVLEEADFRTLAESLRTAPPVLLASANNARPEAASIAWRAIERRVADQSHAAIFGFAWRMAVGIGWLAVVAAGFHFHEEYETTDLALGVLGAGFVGYTIMRHGYAIVRWHNRRVDATHAFGSATIHANPLATRLSAALELRTTLKAAERGQSPDDELLDTNAYRKLIVDGTTTSAELIRLGEALNAALKFQDEHGQARRIAAIAKECGIDAETALFYRDLSAAASEIKLLDRVKTE